MPFERWLRILGLRLVSIARGGAADRDLDDELRDHVERLTAANLARGMTPAEARRAALLAMDGVEQQKERCRDARGIQTIDELRTDLR